MNTRYKIKTDVGFVGFNSVVKKEAQSVKLRFTDETNLICSLDHLLKRGNTFVRAASLKPGNVVSGKRLVSITCVGHQILYDVVNSETSTYLTNGILSHNCSFMGSSNTLLSGDMLQRLVYKNPIAHVLDGKMAIYEHPAPGHYYVMAVDVAEGTGGDYSIVNVIDVTSMPYKQVAVYRHNLIQPIPFTKIVHDIGVQYNDAYAIVENNSIGKIVADSLFFDFEYESIFCSGGSGQMFDVQNLGVRTTKKVKALGCSNLKAMIEGSRLVINDFNTVTELSTFSQTKTGSYAAEKGKHDDIAMTLVLFAYVTSLEYFEDITNIDFRQNIRQAFEESDNLSYMFIDDGIDEYE